MVQTELSKWVAMITPDDIEDRKCILTYVPFKGSERYCWDCGEQRSILIETDLDGNLLNYQEVCG